MSTLSNFGLIILIILFAVSVWALVVSVMYKKELDGRSYARGANVWKPGDVELNCGDNKEICVYRATQICTDPDENNFENDETDPINSGYNHPDDYGKYNTDTTINLTSDMSDKCDGEQKCTYKFSGDWPGDSSLIECGGTTQLIATYSCIPKGTECKSST